MIEVRPVLRALAATGCALAIAGCSFEGSIATASPAAADAGAHANRTSSPASTPEPPTTETSTPQTSTPETSTPETSETSTPAATTASPTDGDPVTAPDDGGAAPLGAASSTGAAAPSATDRCHSGDLVGRLATADSSSGHRHATIELRNISGQTCQVRGYGGVQLIDEFGQSLPTEQVRVSSPPPAGVTVVPGGTTTSQLTWGTVPGEGDAEDGPCQPTPTTLAVIPPNETQPLALAWSLGPVCQGGTIEQQPYR